MPFYEYECPDGHITEDLRPMPERHDPIGCEVCGKKAEFAVSVPLGHIWEERAGSTILTRGAAQAVCRGRTKSGQEYRTIGGPHPDADTFESDGD